jgi:hypothetical protein
MAFAILRLNKLKTFGNIGGLSAHIERTMDCPNADKSLQHLNQKFVGTGNLCADVQTRIESAGVKPQTDSVLAVEFLMSASPDYFKEGFSGSRKSKLENFCRNSKVWLKQNFGEENLVEMTLHMDESTPHIHAVIVPIVEKKVKIGRSIKREVTQNRLTASDFFDGREKLSDLQTSFAQFHGLERGIKGSKAKHTTVKEFYTTVTEVSNQKALEEQKQLDWPAFELKEPNIKDNINPRDYALGEVRRFKALLEPKVGELLDSRERIREIAKKGLKTGIMEAMETRKDSRTSQTERNLNRALHKLQGLGTGYVFKEGQVEFYNILQRQQEQELKRLQEEERKNQARLAQQAELEQRAKEEEAKRESFPKKKEIEEPQDFESSLTEKELEQLQKATWVRYNHHAKEFRTSNNLIIKNDMEKIMEALQITENRGIKIMSKGLGL